MSTNGLTSATGQLAPIDDEGFVDQGFVVVWNCCHCKRDNPTEVPQDLALQRTHCPTCGRKNCGRCRGRWTRAPPVLWIFLTPYYRGS